MSKVVRCCSRSASSSLPLGDELRQALFQLDLNVGDGLGQRRAGRHVVAVCVDVNVGQFRRDLAGQRVELADRLDFVAEQADAPGAVLVMARVDIHRLAAQAEGAALEGDVVAAVLLLGQGAGQGVAVDAAADFQLDHHPRVGLDRADAVDAGHGGDDDDVVAFEQGLRRGMAHAVDRLVDLAVLLDIGVAAGDIGFGLVVVVVADEILDGVVREEAFHFPVELRGQRFVRRQDQRRPLRLFDQLGHGERLAGAGDAEQHLVALVGLDAGPQVLDGGGLVARRLVFGHDAQPLRHRLDRLAVRRERHRGRCGAVGLSFRLCRRLLDGHGHAGAP